jgi:hypothetical protein
MGILLTACALVLLLVAISFACLFRKLASHEDIRQWPADWLQEEPAAKYRPMERLLDESDTQFLASFPELAPCVGHRLRVERRRIFRAYMRSLRRDFGRIYSATKLLILYSEVDRPDLAMELLRQRAQFAYGMLVLECLLVCHTVGVGRVDVRGLIGSLDRMRLQLKSLAPLQAAA